MLKKKKQKTNLKNKPKNNIFSNWQKKKYKQKNQKNQTN